MFWPFGSINEMGMFVDMTAPLSALNDIRHTETSAKPSSPISMSVLSGNAVPERLWKGFITDISTLGGTRNL